MIYRKHSYMLHIIGFLLMLSLKREQVPICRGEWMRRARGSIISRREKGQLTTHAQKNKTSSTFIGEFNECALFVIMRTHKKLHWRRRRLLQGLFGDLLYKCWYADNWYAMIHYREWQRLKIPKETLCYSSEWEYQVLNRKI